MSQTGVIVEQRDPMTELADHLTEPMDAMTELTDGRPAPVLRPPPCGRAGRAPRSDALRRRALVVTVVACCVVLAPAGCTAPESGRPEDLAEDFDRLVRLLERTHPDPYTAFGGVESFRERTARFQDEARQLRTVAGLHALSQRFLATLRDGHTSMDPLPGRERGADECGPLRLGIAADVMYVRNAVPELADYVGSRVLAVNGIPLETAVDSVRARFPAENRFGGMERLRQLVACRRGSWPPFLAGREPMRVILATVAGDTVVRELEFSEHRRELARRESSLGLAGDNGLLWGKVLKHQGRTVGYFAWNAVVSREVAEAAYARDPSTSRRTFDWLFRYLPDATRTEDRAEDLSLAPSLYERFSRLLADMESSEAEHLIVDLRRNGGGMTPLVYTLLYMLYGDEVITSDLEIAYDVRLSALYLAKIGLDDIAGYNARRGTDYSLGDFRRGYLFKNDLGLSLEERRKAEGLTLAGYGAEYWSPVDEGARYSPGVVVLTSPTTFSAAFHFTYFLTEIGSAVVLGVPPRQAPNAFMESTHFELPNSGLTGSISNAVQTLYPADHPRAKIFVPDFAMTWNDFREYEFDPNAEVLFALDLMGQARIPGRGEGR